MRTLIFATILIFATCNTNEQYVTDVSGRLGKQDPAYADLVIVPSNNVWGIAGTASAFDEYGNGVGTEYNCDIANLGVGIRLSGEYPDFLRIVVAKVVKNQVVWDTTYSKDAYHALSCYMPAFGSPNICTSDSILTGQYDEYGVDAWMKDEGYYAVRATCNNNPANGILESNFKNNSYNFGVHYVPCPEACSVCWCATRNDSILTPKIVNYLAHHK